MPNDSIYGVAVFNENETITISTTNSIVAIFKNNIRSMRIVLVKTIEQYKEDEKKKRHIITALNKVKQ